jgi:hypothetical protein
MLNAEKGVRRRVRKSRQKEAAGAVDAGLMQIECSEQRVSKLAGVAKAAAEGPDAAVQTRGDDRGEPGRGDEEDIWV